MDICIYVCVHIFVNEQKFCRTCKPISVEHEITNTTRKFLAKQLARHMMSHIILNMNE